MESLVTSRSSIDQMAPPALVPTDGTDAEVKTLRVVLVSPAPTLHDALVCAVGATEDLVCVGSGPTIGAASGIDADSRKQDGGEKKVDVVVIHCSTPGADLLAEVAVARHDHPRATVAVVAGYVDAYLVERLTTIGATLVMSTDTALVDLFDAARHAILAELTGIDVYFAEPHSPWQRLTNENGNGLIRRYVGKGTNLHAYRDADLRTIEHRLNTMPRRSLDWSTAAHVYDAAVAMTG